MKRVSAEIMQREWENKEGAREIKAKREGNPRGLVIWASTAIRCWGPEKGKEAAAAANQRSRAEVTEDRALDLPNQCCSSRLWLSSCSCPSRQVKDAPEHCPGRGPAYSHGRGPLRSSAQTAPRCFQPQPVPGAGNFSGVAGVACLLLSSFVSLDLNLVGLFAKKTPHLISDYHCEFKEHHGKT